MHQQHGVFGMANRPGHLLWGEPHVHGVQHSAEHRHSKEEFEVAVAIPVHHANAIPSPHAERGQHRRGAIDPCEELGVVVLAKIAIGNRLMRSP
jgi:hypothetical protein